MLNPAWACSLPASSCTAAAARMQPAACMLLRWVRRRVLNACCCCCCPALTARIDIAVVCHIGFRRLLNQLRLLGALCVAVAGAVAAAVAAAAGGGSGRGGSSTRCGRRSARLLREPAARPRRAAAPQLPAVQAAVRFKRAGGRQRGSCKAEHQQRGAASARRALASASALAGCAAVGVGRVRPLPKHTWRPDPALAAFRGRSAGGWPGEAWPIALTFIACSPACKRRRAAAQGGYWLLYHTLRSRQGWMGGLAPRPDRWKELCGLSMALVKLGVLIESVCCRLGQGQEAAAGGSGAGSDRVCAEPGVLQFGNRARWLAIGQPCTGTPSLTPLPPNTHRSTWRMALATVTARPDRCA